MEMENIKLLVILCCIKIKKKSRILLWYWSYLLEITVTKTLQNERQTQRIRISFFHFMVYKDFGEIICIPLPLPPISAFKCNVKILFHRWLLTGRICKKHIRLFIEIQKCSCVFSFNAKYT